MTDWDGATVRTAEVLSLITELRKSGYPRHRAHFNTEAALSQRSLALCGRYGEETIRSDEGPPSSRTGVPREAHGYFDLRRMRCARGTTLSETGVVRRDAPVIVGRAGQEQKRFHG